MPRKMSYLERMESVSQQRSLYVLDLPHKTGPSGKHLLLDDKPQLVQARRKREFRKVGWLEEVATIVPLVVERFPCEMINCSSTMLE
jgi:hypothetical protein